MHVVPMTSTAQNTSQPNKNTERAVAWLLSIGMHLGIGVIAFFVTWSVIRTKDEPPRVVTSTWHELEVNDASVLPMALPLTPETPIEVATLPELPKLERDVQDGFAVLHQVSTGAPLPELARREVKTEVQFMGLEAVAAKRIVYVVDASGSMLLYLSTVLKELERSLRTLHPNQEFGVVFFQNDKTIPVPPKRSLVSANAANISDAMRWINTSGEVVPTGGK